jgi:hypothetical protein
MVCGSEQCLFPTAEGNMHPDPRVVVWPDYQEFYSWLQQEVAGLNAAQLDFDSQDPAQEWMWWSIRRQVSHMAWDLLMIMHRRCAMFLWPDGHPPRPIDWQAHRLPNMAFDRRLDETLYWDMAILLDKVKLGVDWATQVVSTVPVDILRATQSRHRGTHYWRHVIQVLPRGAWIDAQDPAYIHYTLEASLWMLYWEVLTHLYTIQRLKRAQGLSTQVTLPLVGYLTLPEYRGDTPHAAPAFTPLR